MYSKVIQLYISMYLFSFIFPYKLLQSIEYTSLCYTVGPCWFSISYIEPQQDGRCWSDGCLALKQPWGDTPWPRAKVKPQQDSRRGKITFRIKSHTPQRHSEGSNKPCAHHNSETPQRRSQNCVWVSPAEVQVSSGLLQGQGLLVQQTGYDISPLGGVRH